MGRYKEERKPAVRRQKNTMRLQMTQSEGSAVHFGHDFSTTGPHAAISVKGNLKEGSG